MPANPCASELRSRALVLLACGSASAPPPPAPEPTPAPPPAATTKTPTEPLDAKGIASPAMPGKNVPAVKVNTVGYPPAWKKIVVFNVEPRRAVVQDERAAVAYETPSDRISSRGKDEASGDPIWQADVSALERPGRFTISGTRAS